MSQKTEPMGHVGEMIDITESDEAAHRNWLAEFNEKVWPIYQRYGFSRDAALTFWELNRIRNTLSRIEDLIEEGEQNPDSPF